MNFVEKIEGRKDAMGIRKIVVEFGLINIYWNCPVPF